MIPNHVAFIMDGNGRWAKAQGKPRTFGHKKGGETLEQICEDANSLGIKYVTFYAFSTENWKRSEEEVSYLMGLLKHYLNKRLKDALKNNMRIRILGDISVFDKQMQEAIHKVEEATKDGSGLQMQIALNYGGRNEIVRATKKMYDDIEKNNITIDKIDETIFANYLDTKEIPDPDLLIRTSGELRLSNFLIWQLAYTEYYFTDVPWPEFSRKDLEDAIRQFGKRDRRYGGIKDAN